MKKYLLVIALLFIIPFPVKAQSISIAVIGDSLSHEYRAVPRGNSTSYNWVEILGRIRGVNFGTLTNNNYAYDYAWSGNTVSGQMAGMVTKALSDSTNRVIILLGYNDIAGGANVTSTINTYSLQVDRLLTKYASGDILAVSIPQADCGDNNANINSFNSQLQALATNKGIHFAGSLCPLLNAYAINANEYNYGGQIVNRWSWCHVNCLKLPNDGHPGTIAQAMIANTVTSFLGVSNVTEAEVLALMGIGSVPTSTPTRTATPAPTFTPTPIILSCPVGYHWIGIDARSVQCVGD